MVRKLQQLVTILAAAAVAVAAVETASASDAPFECTTNGKANWSVVASAPAAVACPTGGNCTRMGYTITPLMGMEPDHVAVLVDHDVTVVPADSRDVSPPCDGDTVTEIGIRDCSTQAVRLNKDDDTGAFGLLVEGDAGPTGASIVVKKGKVIEECRIASLGPSTCDPKAQLASKETFMFEECEVEITVNPCTGEPGEATVLSGDCVISAQPIENLQLVINGQTQNVTVGSGWLSSGENSCTTRWYGRTPYLVCNCKDSNDPNPPCD